MRIAVAAILLTLLAAPALAQSPDRCAGLRKHGQIAPAEECYSALVSARDPYLRAEGLWGLRRYQDASNEFKQAVQSRPKDPLVRVRWGRLFLERFNAQDALQLFQEALELDRNYVPAMVGIALVAANSFENKAREMAEAAANKDPRSVEARELLARLALEDNDLPRAAGAAAKALALSPDALDALAVQAAIEWMKQPDPSPEATTPSMEQVLKINPHYGQAYAFVARNLVLNRRYEEGIRFYARALELDPSLWGARSEMGVNLMRLGRDAEARRNLELSYNNGQTDAATVNTLRLLDSYKNFDFIRAPASVLKLHKKEAAMLRPYVESEMRRALATYEKKYKLKLDAPVQVELYPDHDDFAVRTVGMPGVGLLGVTFGHVVAMDSPSGRPPGSFHWASTMWHELSHVYVLTATHHRVPRWFTEGMAVHEETAVSPEWGDRLTPEIIAALKEKKLLPIAQLDRGFVRPTYPTQVIVSYYQAGRICDYINERWGFNKLLDMMNDFAQMTPTPEVVERQLGVKPEEFDKSFLAWLDAQTRKTVDGFEEWDKRRKVVSAAAKAHNYDQVIQEGRAIRDLYPEYVEGGSIYEYLAAAYEAKGDKQAALAELDRYARAGGRSPESLKKLAALQEEAGDRKSAAASLQRINYIDPVQDEDLHQRLGDLYMDLGQVDAARVEYEVVLASRPLDPAGAHFRLAQAFHKANRNDLAQEQLLLSLEAAPGYRPAQKMLLELHRESAPKKEPTNE